MPLLLLYGSEYAITMVKGLYLLLELIDGRSAARSSHSGIKMSYLPHTHEFLQKEYYGERYSL